MKARAPGKVVISGAYSVLEGAPAIVSAVDRYAVADSERAPDWVSPEVQAALGQEQAPYVDASALRERGQKLGLGSSAAILVASLAARLPAGALSGTALQQLEQQALAAHRHAQGGGSGIDVVASVRGGTLACRRSATGLDVQPARLPPGLVVEVWASGAAASTAKLLGSVAQLARSAPASYREIMDALRAGAERAVLALQTGQSRALIDALDEQRAGFLRLGRAAGEAIVTPELELLARAGAAEHAVVLPSGAGGGDIALWAGEGASSADFRRQAHTLGHALLAVALHAQGVHQLR
jgi:phosphomevalonate kinase